MIVNVKGFRRTVFFSPGIWIYQDLSYGEILAGRPGAWLVKKNIFHMHAITKLKKYLIFKIISRTSLVFMIAFMVYE